MTIVIPYVKQTWTDGSGGGTPVSAARLGVLEEGILDVSQSPAVRVTHNASQSIADSTSTALAFNTERYDQAGGASSTMHDTVTNNSRLTAIYAGIYSIKGMAEFNDLANTGGTRRLDIRLNGTTLIGSSSTAYAGDSKTRVVVVADYSMAVNDYVELIVWQTSTVAKNVVVTANVSPEFMMVRVG